MVSKKISFSFFFTTIFFISVQSIVIPESTAKPAENKPASLTQADKCQQDNQLLVQQLVNNDYQLFGNSLYKYFTYGATWFDAINTCAIKKKGSLAVIDTNEKLGFLINLREKAKREMEQIYCRKLDYLALWIGVHALSTESHQWMTVDERLYGPELPFWATKDHTRYPVNYKDWYCGSLIESGVNNNHCNYTTGFICEVKIPDCPPPQPDCKVQLQMSKAYCQYMSRVLIIQSIRNGYQYRNGGLYRLFVDGKSWHQANKTCVEREGGHLAVIETKDEEQELTDMLFKKKPSLQAGAQYSQMVWIGIHSLYQPNKWMTVTGQPLDPNSGYVHWATSSNGRPNPDDYDGRLNCGSLRQGGFDDNPCDCKLGYICEIPILC